MRRQRELFTRQEPDMYNGAESSADRAEQHAAAVRMSLGWAQESADRGDYADALGWIGVLDAIGERIPPSYEAKRRSWDGELSELRAGLPPF
jgi:hypothetical protein